MGGLTQAAREESGPARDAVIRNISTMTRTVFVFMWAHEMIRNMTPPGGELWVQDWH